MDAVNFVVLEHNDLIGSQECSVGLLINCPMHVGVPCLTTAARADGSGHRMRFFSLASSAVWRASKACCGNVRIGLRQAEPSGLTAPRKGEDS